MRQERYDQAKLCAHCGAEFQAARSHARTCSARCKKAVQRSAKKAAACLVKRKGNVPFLAAAKKETPDEIVNLAKIMEEWPHGKEVLFRDPKCYDHESWKPGRINWLSRVGEAMKKNQTAHYKGMYFMVPVETLTEIMPLFTYEVKVSPF